MSSAHLFIIAVSVLSLALSAWVIHRDKPPVWQFAVPETPDTTRTPYHKTVFDYDIDTGQAHAPALVMSADGVVDLMWFEGSAEAQADVDIWSVRLSQHASGEWQSTAPAPRITRSNLGQAMVPRQLVVTLGNTVQNTNAPHRVFATVVSVGGWAMASIADVTLGPSGPVTARKLNLSPFLNRSHLVKSPMVTFADGSSGLPAYFELGATYGSLVRFDADGRVRDAARMTGAGKPIQPMIVPLDDRRAVAFLRDFSPSGRLLMSLSNDGGQSWSPAEPTDLPNPSAPVAALPLGEDRILMVANDDPGGADRLSLLLSEDVGTTWRATRVLEENGAGARYPILQALPDGQIMLAYSIGNKRGLRVRSFNLAWALGQ